MRCLFGSSPTVSGTEFALGIPTAEFGTNTAVPDFAQRQRNGHGQTHGTLCHNLDVFGAPAPY